MPPAMFEARRKGSSGLVHLETEEWHGMGRTESVGVVDKVITLFLCFTPSEPELDLQQIVQRTGLNKSTACRILRKLARYKLIDQDPRSSCYRLGMRLFELGNIVGNGLRLPEIGQPYLQDLTARTGETSHLAILDEGDVVHIVREESTQPIRVIPSQIGRRYPFYCTAVGKVMAAQLPDAERAALIEKVRFEAFTPRTVSNQAELRAQLAEIRRVGYALDNAEYLEGIRCVAKPILGIDGRLVGGISVSGPVNRITMNKTKVIAEIIAETTDQISRILSGADPLPKATVTRRKVSPKRHRGAGSANGGVRGAPRRRPRKRA